jgi:glycosyltransferase involved in cell wall biosynthesis
MPEPGRAAGRRLLYVCNNPAFFASYRLTAARAARDAGFDVHVATPDGPAAGALERAGLTHHAIPLRRRSFNPLHGLQTVAALRRLYARLRPDVIEHMTIQAMLFGSLAARTVRTGRVINWMAGLGFLFVDRGRRSALARPAVLTLYRTALGVPGSRAVFENPDQRDYFVARGLVPGARTSVIEGAGVEMERFAPTPQPEGTPVVLFAGRMIWDKGVRDFVAAVELLRARGTPARFVLVGEPDPGNPASVDERQLRAWHEAGVVEWHGASDRMADEYRRCSIFCFPTAYAEGVPRVLIEAAASARPIVTTDMPGCREVVRPGVNGLLVPPRDPAAVAAAIERLVGDRAARAAMGARGRRHVEERFSVRTIVAQTLALYESAVAAGA